MSEANNDIAIQFKLQRDMAWAEIERLWAELARVTKERDEATAEAETTKAFYADTDKQRRDGISELAADMVQMSIRHAHEIDSLSTENAELRADRDRLTKLLSDCLGILEIALRAHPGGAFLNAVCEEDLPRFRAAIDAAREEQKSADDTPEASA